MLQAGRFDEMGEFGWKLDLFIIIQDVILVSEMLIAVLIIFTRTSIKKKGILLGLLVSFACNLQIYNGFYFHVEDFNKNMLNKLHLLRIFFLPVIGLCMAYYFLRKRQYEPAKVFSFFAACLFSAFSFGQMLRSIFFAADNI